MLKPVRSTSQTMIYILLINNMINDKAIKEHKELLTQIIANNTYVWGDSNPIKEIHSSIELV